MISEGYEICGRSIRLDFCGSRSAGGKLGPGACKGGDKGCGKGSLGGGKGGGSLRSVSLTLPDADDLGDTHFCDATTCLLCHPVRQSESVSNDISA